MGNYSFIENGGVTSAQGFKAAGVTAGFKRSGAPDFAMIYSETAANFAGVFTSCTFAAAPVRYCRERVRESQKVRAVIVNSGNANACTGGQGVEAVATSCRIAAAALGNGIKPDDILAASTGRIGVQLPLDKIEAGVVMAAGALSGDKEAGMRAAQAIMTTDTVPKYAALELEIGGKKVVIGAMTKGAGMIDPNLVRVPHATMLCFVTTDAGLDNELLEDILAGAAENSFNRITIDGDMSTNDTCVLLANGKSGVKIAPGTPEKELFATALTGLLQYLAKMMVIDGEGATRLVEVKISGAPTVDDAKKCAEAIANSLLCKTAWFGGDPNWGRVVAALGYSKANFDPDKVNIRYGDQIVVRDGGDAGTCEEELAEAVSAKEFTIAVDLGSGESEYWMWSCDLSYEYVKINADYHT